MPNGRRQFDDRQLCLIFISVLSFFIHFMFLWHPKRVVFDEVHYGKYVTAYCCTGERIFDVHPPHTKLLMALIAKIGGYSGQLRFDHINQPYEDYSIFWLRFIPALAGTLVPLVMFLLIGQLGGSLWASFLGALALVFENALIVQTRIIALDGVLLLACLACLSSFLGAENAQSPEGRVIRYLLSGVFAALAVGTKFTGLAIVAVLAIMLIRRAFERGTYENLFFYLRQGIWIASGFFITYLSGWMLHFSLLQKPGLGDNYFQAQNQFAKDTVMLHERMLASNANIRKQHPFSSPWWSWPLMKIPIYYSHAEGKKIFFLGNPLVWWGTSLIFFAIIINLLLFRVTNLKTIGRPKSHQIWIPVLAFAVSYISYIPVQRPLFMYHYLPPLLFSLIAVILWLDSVGWIRPGGFLRQRLSYHLAWLMLITCFIAVSPYTFGYQVPRDWEQNILYPLVRWGR